MSFRNLQKPSKWLKPSSDSLLRNIPEKLSMTQVKGRRKEKKIILKEKVEEEKKVILALSENLYQLNLCNFYNYVLLCLGKLAFLFLNIRKELL